MLLAIALWAFAPVLIVWLKARSFGGTFTGIDSATPLDQFQYMGWIRDASQHWLIGNPFELAPAAHVFPHPMFFLSGVMVRAGLSVPVAYLIWKPVAVVLLFGACWAYAGRVLGRGPLRQAAAVVLAVFTVTPASLLIDHDGAPLDWLAVVNQASETSSGLLLWGYAPSVISIALMPILFLAVERLLDPDRRAPGRGVVWYAAWASLCALAMTWLHPWEGQVALLVLAGVAIWRRRRDVVWLLAPAGTIAAALAFYWGLAQTELHWERAHQVALDVPRAPVWVVVTVLAGMVLAALPGIRTARLDVQEVVLRVWPLATLLLLYLPGEPVRHALQSIMIPLAMLATRAGMRAIERARRSGRPRAVRLAVAGCALFVLLFTVPGLAEFGRAFRDRLGADRPPVAVRDGERAAMRWLESAPPGGVFTTAGLGLAVPALSGHRVWVAHYTWTPDYVARAQDAQLAVRVDASAARTRAIVMGSGARYVLLPCGARPQLATALRPVAVDSHAFGCASVITVR